MQWNPKAKLLPIFMLPAIMPAVLLPVMVNLHAPDGAIGGAMGFSLGLAVVGVAWMAKTKGRCFPGR